MRFLDNFSAGTRGACSAEYFIENGYAVIFLHRQFSLEPYTRNYTHSKNCFLDMIQQKGNDLVIAPEYSDKMKPIFQKYQKVIAENLMLKITFLTVTDYLFLLKSATIQMSSLGKRSMFYLAAAVSDFFIPEKKLVEHKIQSSVGDGLNLKLDAVPKIIRPLVNDWATKGFIVSFKLETDPSLLISKSMAALERYGHQLVVGNILETRKRVVWFISPNSKEVELRLSQKQVEEGEEIEKFIVEYLVGRHQDWIVAHET